MPDNQAALSWMCALKEVTCQCKENACVLSPLCIQWVEVLQPHIVCQSGAQKTGGWKGSRMHLPMGSERESNLDLSLEQKDAIFPIAHALASPVRLDIIEAISQRNMNVNELATSLDIPLSTAALNVRVLEEAGIILTHHQPGIRGAMKLCSRKLDRLQISLSATGKRAENAISMQMPVGGYSLCAIQPGCGLAGTHGAIGMDDDPRTFYHPDRHRAQLLWFHAGYVEYHFAAPAADRVPLALEVVFEACSEAPEYDNHLRSDITLWINGVDLGTWICPGDFGGRRGLLNPAWWPDSSTQFGHLKTWRITAEGATLDGMHISAATLADLALDAQPRIAVRIGIKPDAAHAGGMNLFGEDFGDYPQAIVMNITYRAGDA